MTTKQSPGKTDFDEFSTGYDASLAQGLTVSGEDKDYFARGRIAWLADCLEQLRESPQSVMDFGCGTGTSVPFLLDVLAVKYIVGLDVSMKSLAIAQQSFSCERAQFMTFSRYQPQGTLDLAFCNGVFHHIPLDERASNVNYIYQSLRPGGLFAFWENNPWNPGTRYVMSRIPFDRDAVTLTPPVARRLLETASFEILRTDFLFIFPRVLSWFRAIEPFVSSLPFGAQYQVLCRKPSNRN